MPIAGGDASAVTGMAFAGDSGWACGYVAALPDGKTIQDSDVPSYGSPMLWTYQNGGWVALPAEIMLAIAILWCCMPWPEAPRLIPTTSDPSHLAFDTE